jgi:hypothetical protein
MEMNFWGQVWACISYILFIYYVWFIYDAVISSVKSCRLITE